MAILGNEIWDGAARGRSRWIEIPFEVLGKSILREVLEYG